MTVLEVNMQVDLKHNYLNIASTAVLFCIIFGTSVLARSLQKGTGNTIRRLGADLMMVPSKSEATEETILSGSREYNYFSRDLQDTISKNDNVKTVTPQFYLSSLEQECCSTGKVSVIGFDPETDFLVIPWLSKGQLEKIKEGYAVTGSDVTVGSHEAITLYGTEYPVAGVLAKTGTLMDSSIYFSLDLIPKLVEEAKSKGYGFIAGSDGSDLVSTLFVNLKEEVNPSSAIYELRKLSGDQVSVISTKGIAKSLSKSFLGFSRGIGFVSVFTAIVSVLVLFVVNVISSQTKKRRYALMRISGASKSVLYFYTALETLLFSIIGILSGTILATAVIFPFGTLIGESLEMPFLLPSVLESLLLWTKTLIIMIAISTAAGIWPAYRILAEDPYTALRGEE